MIIVWTDTVATDGPDGARKAAAIFDDPRVRQFHDPKRRLGEAIAGHIDMPALAEAVRKNGGDPKGLEKGLKLDYLYGPAAVFDTAFFFAPEREWKKDAASPTPDRWVTQLDPSIYKGLDPERFHWGEAFETELQRLLAELREEEKTSD